MPLQERRISTTATLATLFITTLLLAACGGGGGDSNDATDANNISVNATELPPIAGVSALSTKYVEVRFAESADPAVAGNIANYSITLPNGNSVPVVGSFPREDGSSVLLQLEPAEEDVQLIPNGTLYLDLVSIDDQPIQFTGNGSEEPTLTSTKSLSDTAVFLAFNEPVSDSAGQVRNYRLTSANGQPLDVKTATLGAGADTVMLTTAQQADVYYSLAVENVTSRISNLPLYLPASGETFLGTSLATATAEPPSVVSAASLGNTRVLVVFNKPMSDDTPIPANFAISQANVNSEAGFLGVRDARFASADRQAVELTTWSQNEVTYEVKVTNATDRYGQQLKVSNGTTVVVTANTATFAGTPPGATELVDTDGDGLYDNEEQSGYTVIIELANGDIVTREVTSDPAKADTDGDGLNDSIELQYGMNPRVTDTDGDGLNDNLELNTIFSNPFAQDSDLDGLQDGFEHFDLSTSVILADSDGDQLTDAQELFELNRDPKVADVPQVNIEVGDVRLQIDERYSYTDESGQVITEDSNTSTTLAKSDNTSFSKSDTHTDEYGGGGGFRTGVGSGNFFGGGSKDLSGGIEVTGFGYYTGTNSWQSERSSARESQEAYEQSLAKGLELSTTETVTREVVGASIEVPVTITNEGNVPFTLRNLEITVLQQVGSRDRFLPVATLVANSELTTGTPLTITLGGTFTERGPFIFSSREVFPQLVESLLRNPSSLIFRVANYDVEDELGRNYSFISQVARDRTASITLDFGDAEAASNYLLATNGVLQNDQYLGGFSPSGKSLGLPLSYLLESSMGFPRHQTQQDVVVAGFNDALESTPAGDDVLDGNLIRTGPNGWLETRPAGDDFVANPTGVSGIIAGLNKTADSIAQGDDIQLVALNSDGLSLGTVVIDPGENGVLDTPARGDDTVDFIGGYETSRTCSAFSENAGAECRVDGDCQTGTCSGPQKLVRIKSLRNGDFNRAWVVLTSGQLPDAADFDLITVESGNNLSLAFLQDLDGDGLFARNEFLYGSTDSARDQFDNNTFGPDFLNQAQSCASASACDGQADSVDSDQDGLSDFAEVFVGWKVAIDGGALRQTYSSPRFADTDGDGLADFLEQDLREFCAPASAPRSQALCAFQNEEAITQADAIGIIAGLDKTAGTIATGDDEQLTPEGMAGLAYGTPVVGPGPNGTMDTAPAGDDVYEAASSIPPATDPTEPDTDRDNLSDYDELKGFEALLAIIDGGNQTAESSSSGDDIQRVFLNNPVAAGAIIILPGANGALDSTPGGDDALRPSQTVTTDPLRRDTDDDSVADGNEQARGSDPTINDAASFSDQDQDGLTDAEESMGWSAQVITGVGPGLVPSASPVTSSPSLPDSDFDGLADFVERDLRLNPNRADSDGDGISDYDEVADLSKYLAVAALYPNLNITSANTGGYGTNPAMADTDEDGLTDRQELIEGFRLSLPGATTATTVYTSPLFDDTDLDGANDGQEVAIGTDPTNADTDGDGSKDGAEIAVGTDPLTPDLAFQVVFRDIVTNQKCTDDPNASTADLRDGEVMWWIVIEDPQTGEQILLSDALDAEYLQGSDETDGAYFYLGETIAGSDYSSRDNVPGSFPLTLSPRACYYKRGKFDSSWLQLNMRSRVLTLSPGDSFGLQAAFIELDGAISEDCGKSPNFIPQRFQASEVYKSLRLRYSYDDLAQSPGGISLTQTDATDVVNAGSCTIDFRLDIDVLGEKGPKPVGFGSP